jgi:hypothetical protein
MLPLFFISKKKKKRSGGNRLALCCEVRDKIEHLLFSKSPLPTKKALEGIVLQFVP